MGTGRGMAKPGCHAGCRSGCRVTRLVTMKYGAVKVNGLMHPWAGGHHTPGKQVAALLVWLLMAVLAHPK